MCPLSSVKLLVGLLDGWLCKYRALSSTSRHPSGMPAMGFGGLERRILLQPLLRPLETRLADRRKGHIWGLFGVSFVY